MSSNPRISNGSSDPHPAVDPTALVAMDASPSPMQVSLDKLAKKEKTEVEKALQRMMRAPAAPWFLACPTTTS